MTSCRRVRGPWQGITLTLSQNDKAGYLGIDKQALVLELLDGEEEESTKSVDLPGDEEEGGASTMPRSSSGSHSTKRSKDKM